MATHSSVLAWRIPGTGEPGGLPSMGSHRVGHDLSDLVAAAVWAVSFADILSVISFANIFSHSVDYLFVLFMVSFGERLRTCLLVCHLYLKFSTLPISL